MCRFLSIAFAIMRLLGAGSPTSSSFASSPLLRSHGNSAADLLGFCSRAKASSNSAIVGQRLLSSRDQRLRAAVHRLDEAPVIDGGGESASSTALNTTFRSA